MNDPIAVDPRYVAARRVLLDALSALAPHGPAVIVAGAQAVYLRTGASDLAIAPFTTDGDLAIDPALLDVAPQLEDAMRAAGFRLSLTDGHVEPGIWMVSAVVDGVEVTSGRRGRPGVRMAARALRLAVDEQLVETLCVAYTSELRRVLATAG